MRRWIAWLCSFAMCLCLFTGVNVNPQMTAQAQELTAGDFSYTVRSDGTAEITDYTGTATEVVIPDTIDGYTVAFIGVAAFYGCTDLVSVTIPDSVTSIGDSAFSDCSVLTEIDVDEGNDAYSDIDGVLFDKLQIILIQYPCGKTDTEYSVPDSVTTIGAFAFLSCESLSSITIPDSVTSIGWGVFADCTKFTDVYYGDNEEQWRAIDIGDENAELSNATIHYNATMPTTTTEEPQGFKGDLSGDGKVTIADAVMLYYHVNGKTPLGSDNGADMNDDGKVNIQDAVKLYYFVNGKIGKL